MNAFSLTLDNLLLISQPPILPDFASIFPSCDSLKLSESIISLLAINLIISAEAFISDTSSSLSIFMSNKA